MNDKKFYLLHSDMCKTLANPKRQEILDSLRKGEMTVTQIQDKTGISQANLSQHLSILRAKGIVSTRRDGSSIYYALTNKKIIQAFDLISQVLRDSLTSQTSTVDSAIKTRK